MQSKSVKKRKFGDGRDTDLDRPLPESATLKPLVQKSLDFKEEMDEDVLKVKSVVTNRAPVMSVCVGLFTGTVLMHLYTGWLGLPSSLKG